MQKNVEKRPLDVLVLSDIHLGTYGCRAKELLNYLESVQPKQVILNGDIIDIWQFNKRYFPKSHLRIVRHFMSLLGQGIPITYITGNHDEALRRFEGFQLGGLKIVNKLMLKLDGKSHWLFHGDVFDVSMKHSKWLAKLGGKGYDALILLNTCINYFSEKMGKGRLSLSKKIKNSVKGAVKHIQNFEDVAAEIAIENKYDRVILGHIHQPEIKTIQNKLGAVEYLNSGDWIENLTALEYNNQGWNLYRYNAQDFENHSHWENNKKYQKSGMKGKELFHALIEEFDALKTVQ